MTSQQMSSTKLFASGLPAEADEEALTKHIERIDKSLRVKSVMILRDYQTFKSKGLAIIEFADTEDCMARGSNGRE
ncbi:MAG: RNA-binding protein [Acidobacteriaceae bacterium]|nr:RNA-binding protein [Acidobacteriaceae bacterium]